MQSSSFISTAWLVRTNGSVTGSLVITSLGFPGRFFYCMMFPAMQKTILRFSARFYQGLLRPILFYYDSERVHNWLTKLGEEFSEQNWGRTLLGKLWRFEADNLRQTIDGITFDNPIGLDAGFDYEARLTKLVHG